MAKVMTVDEAFLRLTVAGDEAGIQALLRTADKASGKSCPECKGTDIMDNGERSIRYLTYACSACGHQWEAAQDRVRA